MLHWQNKFFSPELGNLGLGPPNNTQWAASRQGTGESRAMAQDNTHDEHDQKVEMLSLMISQTAMFKQQSNMISM